MTELLLGIDIGTASTKAVLARPDGSVVAQASRSHATSMPRPGWVEHDAQSVWWADVVALSRQLLPTTRGAIAAVGISGIGPCVVPCDAKDDPLRPAILYGVDTRAATEVRELTQQFGADEILARCGSALSSQALGPKLAWLRQHEPDVYVRTKRWHMASSFVVARLTGRWVLDHHSASQCDPFYDLADCAWDREWLDAVVPELPMPDLAWPSDIVGYVSARAEAGTGIPRGTPVIAGTIDSWAEAASAGVRRPGELMLQYGSTLFLVLGADTRANDDSIWTTRGVDPDCLSIAAGLATGGSLVEWLRELFGLGTFDEIAVEGARSPPGANGLLILPYFAGERTPILDPDARGAIMGLSLHHTRGDIYRAALEGIAYGVRHNLEVMAAAPPTRVVAVGGGTASDLWLQAVSDVTGLTQDVPRVTIGASYGVALLAAEGAQLLAPYSSWFSPARTVRPEPDTHQKYKELFGLYRDLYPATRSIQHALADVQLASGSTC